MRALYLITILGLVLGSSSKESNAQFEKPFYAEGTAHYGYLAAHRTGMKNLVKGHMKPLELTYLKLGNTEPWHSRFNSPYWGVSFFYSDFANPEELGWGIGLAPHLTFHFFKTQRYELNCRMGAGLGYVSKTFDRLENFKNIVIGSHVNLFILARLENRFHISDKLDLVGGIGMTHYSNAAFKMPNLGYNFASAYAGVSYLFGEYDNSPPPPPKDRSTTMEYSVLLAFGASENYPIGGDRFMAASLMATALKPFGKNGKAGIGHDIFYNSAILQHFERDSTNIGSKANIIQNGLTATYQLELNRLSLQGQFGVYLKTLFKNDGLFYHRVGAHVLITENLLLNITLKTHFAKADYLELGFGYRFKK